MIVQGSSGFSESAARTGEAMRREKRAESVIGRYEGRMAAKAEL